MMINKNVNVPTTASKEKVEKVLSSYILNKRGCLVITK